MKSLTRLILLAIFILFPGLSSATMLAADAYTVEVECDYDDDDNVTKCEFSGVTPDDASDILRVTVPAELICTDVLDGDFVRVDLDGGSEGFASEEDDDDFKLELHGRVTTSGTATYLVSTIGRVLPAEGPGLRCDEAQAVGQPVGATATAPSQVTGQDSTTVTLTPVANAENQTTGTLVVATFRCENVPEDRSGFDWFGECTPGAGPLGFNIDNVHDTGMGERAVGTDGGTGEAVFEDVEPGTYKLSPGTGEPSWCHAKSDGVNSQSQVVVQAGITVTVWAFYCDGGNS